jgi:hypothetical protein
MSLRRADRCQPKGQWTKQRRVATAIQGLDESSCAVVRQAAGHAARPSLSTHRRQTDGLLRVWLALQYAVKPRIICRRGPLVPAVARLFTQALHVRINARCKFAVLGSLPCCHRQRLTEGRSRRRASSHASTPNVTASRRSKELAAAVRCAAPRGLTASAKRPVERAASDAAPARCLSPRPGSPCSVHRTCSRRALCATLTGCNPTPCVPPE